MLALLLLLSAAFALPLDPFIPLSILLRPPARILILISSSHLPLCALSQHIALPAAFHFGTSPLHLPKTPRRTSVVLRNYHYERTVGEKVSRLQDFQKPPTALGSTARLWDAIPRMSSADNTTSTFSSEYLRSALVDADVALSAIQEARMLL